MKEIRVLIMRWRRPITFALVGTVNTFVDFITFSLILVWMSILIAQVAGYIAGIVCSFFLNKYFTFQNKAKSTKQAVVFLLVNSFTMFISVLAIHIFHDIWAIQEHFAELFMVTPVTMVLNYFGYKHIVFSIKQ